MKEYRGPKNDTTFPKETTTLLLGSMAPEDSQLALNFETIFPGATRVEPLYTKKSKKHIAHNDSCIEEPPQDRAEVEAAEMIAEELQAAREAAAAEQVDIAMKAALKKLEEVEGSRKRK